MLSNLCGSTAEEGGVEEVVIEAKEVKCLTFCNAASRAYYKQKQDLIPNSSFDCDVSDQRFEQSAN